MSGPGEKRQEARGLRRFRPQLLAWLALVALLGATWGFAYLPLGAGNLVVALAISTAKLLLVAVIFMELRESAALLRLGAAAGFVFLAILLVLTFADVAVRYGGN